MKPRKILFVCIACRWFDKINGNTYHSVRITRTRDNKVIAHELTYGYDECYRQTALEVMLKNGWLPKKYTNNHMGGDNSIYMYERENNYPILWEVPDGLKRDAVRNGTI